MTLLRLALAALFVTTAATAALANAPRHLEDHRVLCPAAGVIDANSRVSRDAPVARCGTIHRPNTVHPEPVEPVRPQVANPWNADDTAMAVGLLDLADALVRGFADFDIDTPNARFEQVIRIALAQRQLSPELLTHHIMALGERFSADQDGALSALMPHGLRASSIAQRIKALPPGAMTAMSTVFRPDQPSRSDRVYE